MPRSAAFRADPELDLVLERVVDVPRELVWKAWTTPEHLMKWFTPAPWKTVDCEIDLRPGGLFDNALTGRRGVPGYQLLSRGDREREARVDPLKPGFRPSTEDAGDVGYFTAIIALEPHGGGTKYTATAIHTDAAARNAHEEMGFHDGWGKALDQLVEVVKKEMQSR